MLQGHYVVLAAEPLCICGIDVAAPQHTRTVGRKLAIKDLRQAFEKQLTHQEVRELCAASSYHAGAHGTAPSPREN